MAKSSLTAKQIKLLKQEFGKMEKIDPASPAYKRMLALLSLLTQKQLKDLVDANIKFVSVLARNRLKKPIEKPLQEKASTRKVPNMSVLNKLSEFASAKPTKEVAPSAALVAHTVQKIRDGQQHSTYELASFVKRLAVSPLTEAQIADRLTDSFADVLIQD